MPDIETQRQYYTERWDQFEYANWLDRARIGKVLQLMTGLDLPRFPAICDLGCGAGWSTNIFSAFGPATGVDLSDISAAQRRYPECRFVSADILTWQPDAHFDVVVSLEVIEHIEEQFRFIDVARRALDRDGYLILTTPNRRTMKALPNGGRDWSNQPIENWLTAPELRTLLRKHGFRVKYLSSIIMGIGTRGSYRLVNSRKINAILRGVGLEPALQATACLARYGLHLVAVAQKT